MTGNISYNNFYGYDEISTDTTKLNPDTLIYSSFDPMYESLDSTNYRLQMYSPLIDAGDPNILDVDGTRSDIGDMEVPMEKVTNIKTFHQRSQGLLLLRNRMVKLSLTGRVEQRRILIYFLFTGTGIHNLCLMRVT